CFSERSSEFWRSSHRALKGRDRRIAAATAYREVNDRLSDKATVAFSERRSGFPQNCPQNAELSPPFVRPIGSSASFAPATSITFSTGSAYRAGKISQGSLPESLINFGYLPKNQATPEPAWRFWLR